MVLQMRTAGGLDDRHALPRIPENVYVLESSHSWISPRGAALVSAPADLGTLTDSVIGAVTALHRETRTRPGGVYLPAAARTIYRQDSGSRHGRPPSGPSATHCRP